MDLIDLLGPGVVGLALGIYFGRLLKAVLANWEGTATAVKWSITAITAVLGGAGGAVGVKFLSGPHAASTYLLGVGGGLLLALLLPVKTTPVSLAVLKTIVAMSDRLQSEHPDQAKRATLILLGIAPAKAIERVEGINEKDLAKEIENATDK